MFLTFQPKTLYGRRPDHFAAALPVDAGRHQPHLHAYQVLTEELPSLPGDGAAVQVRCETGQPESNKHINMIAAHKGKLTNNNGVMKILTTRSATSIS